jgi:alpha-ketoglutarate-dependent taurine dioxygenase
MSGPESNIGPLARARRKGVRIATGSLVETGPLEGGREIPVVVRPALEGVDLVEYAKHNRGEIESRLREHRALLFRGFAMQSASALEKFARGTSDGELLEYRDRSTPREPRGERIYTSTVYRADQRINLHNEGTYWLTWPLKIYFCCLRAAETGGETPIADVSKVYRRIDPRVREEFAAKGVQYVRNYNDGFGLPWQNVFQTEEKAKVEAYCRESGIRFEWKDGGRLRTEQVRPAVQRHPWTGEPLWFNHAAFFHVSALEPIMREALLQAFGEEGLPYNTYFGDGTPIDPSAVAHILEAYREEQTLFPWQAGDLLMLDNMSISHGRESYRGQREVLTAMADPYSPGYPRERAQ